jgi:hypothetical protein
VRNGLFEARFSRNAYQVLLPHIQPDERENQFFLSLNKKKYPLQNAECGMRIAE